MKIKSFILFLSFLMISFTSGKDLSTEEILHAVADEFIHDPASISKELTFGIEVGGEKWHVIVDGKGGVTLQSGFPQKPTFYYTTDKNTLSRIYAGDLSVITAAGRAVITDPAPFNIGFMEGFIPDAGFMDWVLEYTFHFWTIGSPEIIRFGDEAGTRVVHGANVTGLYYQEGFRSAWYRLKSGQHINTSPEEQQNPFPTFIVFTAGEADARIGGKTIKLVKGDSVIIPAGVTHEFWNDNDDPAEFIIIMFGEGA